MTKREALHRWLLDHGEWVYLREVPHKEMGMSLATCSSALASLCDSNRADFRIVGVKQYKGKLSPQQKRGMK